MREDDGVELRFQREDFLRQRFKFVFGHHAARMDFCSR